MSIRKTAPRVLSAVLGLIILCSMVATTAYSAGVKKAAPAKKADTASSASTSEGETFKEETVYVIADAEGTPSKIVVSDWVKNPEKLDKLGDETNLSGVKNVKGDETFTIGKDNQYVWNADGNDIYYQGEGKDDLPVDLKVSFKLDGKSVSPKELAGKSGKVTMRFDYDNKQYKTVKIDGKKEKIYVPFVMLTGTMLDNEKFTNVEVSNGKVINDGSHTIVAGFALPGMGESLNLDTDKFEIPSYVEIKADVKDFELTTTLTVATNDMFSDIDFTKLDEKVDELSDKLGELTSATDKLVDGSSALYKGIHTMLTKSGDLISGVKKLSDGAKALSDGAKTLDNGIGTLGSGVNTLDKGAAKLDKGAGTLNNGVIKLDKGAKTLKNGTSTLEAGISELASGLGTLSSNSAVLTSGAKTVFNTLLSTADTELKAAGLSVDKLTIENYASVLDGVTASLDKDTVTKLAEKTARETVEATVRAQEELIRGKVTAAVQAQVLEQVLAKSGTGMTVEQYSAAVEGGMLDQAVQAQIDGAVSAQMATEAIKTTISTQTEAQIKSLVDTNMESAEVKAQIAAAIEKASAGSASIAALKTQLDSYNTFYEGVINYTNGVDNASYGAQKILGGSGELNTGAKTLKKGTAKLKSGTAELKAGTSELKKGTAKLKSGVSQLKDGSGKLYVGSVELVTGFKVLNDGTGTLVDGVKKLDSGSLTLSDGLKKYKKEGVSAIVDAVDGGAKTIIDRLKAISKVSSAYKSYGGISDDMDGKVQFIYKTDSI